jgi:hypothetical protein
VRENMTLNELMTYYLEGAKVASGGSTQAAPGNSTTVFTETAGGEGYTEQVKARAWGEIESEPVVLMQLPGDRYYALSYGTYREICALLSRDLSDCEVTEGRASSSAKPGGIVHINLEGKPTTSAVAWYEMPPGDLKLFQVDGKQYAISLGAPKTISRTVTRERRTGRFANPDPRREIIWHDFDQSGRGTADSSFPRKPKYLI